MASVQVLEFGAEHERCQDECGNRKSGDVRMSAGTGSLALPLHLSLQNEEAGKDF